MFSSEYTDLYFGYLNEFAVRINTVYLCVSTQVFVPGECKAILGLYLCVWIYPEVRDCKNDHTSLPPSSR
jgi:hypothetical protein